MMKPTIGLLVAGALALAACAGGAGFTSPDPTGGAAGRKGPDFCTTVPPADPTERANWNQLCLPGS